MLSKTNYILYPNYKKILAAISFPQISYKRQQNVLVRYLSEIPDTTDTAPIFIIGLGGRSGSTWIQRLISSTGKVQIYGEFCWLFTPMVNYWLAQFKYSKWKPVKLSRQEYIKKGNMGFIANLDPHEYWDFKQQFRVLLESYFPNTQHLWGFKTVNLSFDNLLLLRACYPEAKIIFLERDKQEQIKSFSKYNIQNGIKKISTLYDDMLIAKNFIVQCNPKNTISLNIRKQTQKEIVCCLADFLNIPAAAFTKECIYTKVNMYDVVLKKYNK